MHGPQRPAVYWIVIGGAYSLINAALQVVLTRVISYVSPLHILTAVSFILSLGIVCMGGGALLSRYVIERKRSIAILMAISIPSSIVLFFCSADLLSPGHHSLIFFQHASFVKLMGVALAIAALPFTLLGAISGACFVIILKEDRRRVSLLIATTAITFLIGYLGSSILIQVIGLMGVVTAIAIIALLPAIPSRHWGVLLLLALGALFIDHGDHIFNILKKAPDFWSIDYNQEDYRDGGWSPYARVDFYQRSPRTLAGVYNGVQQWMVTNNSEEDIDVRRKGYEFYEGDVLIIGAGGGNGVQSLTNARSITAVELDPLVVKTMQGLLGTFNDQIYNKDHVTVHAGDGRAFLDSTDQQFDAIIYEGVDVNVSANKGTIISMENYLYTVEGLQAAIDRLAAEGVIHLYLSSNKILIDKIIASFPAGVYLKHYSGVVQHPFDYQYRLLIASRSQEQLDALPDFFHQMGLPIKELEIPAGSRSAVDPMTDNHPFLYITSAAQIIKLCYLLAGVGVLISLLVMTSKRRQLSLFFAVIGAAFVIVELLAVNIARALLGGFLETAAMVVGFMSIAYAVGNILSRRITMLQVCFVTVAAFAVLLGLVTAGPPTGSLITRLLWILVAVAPVGFAMGLYLPKGMAIAEYQRAGWYYAVDTIGAAFGSIAFYIVIVTLGLNSASVLAFAAYILAALLLYRATR